MDKSKKSGFMAYAATPIMMIVFYVLASLFFLFVFKSIEIVSFFIVLAFIFVLFMSIYALVPLKSKRVFRIISIFFISALLFGLASILSRQNLQIEGFFFYILTGTFGGVIVHYFMGKIIGPLFTGRSWCGWGCWTMMVLELLPFKKSRGWKDGNLKILKYLHFILSFVLVAVLIFVFKYTLHDPNQSPDQPGLMRVLYWFLVGNGLYYLSGIILAIILKDNRAFCKYLCPASLFLKFSNLFSVLRIKGDRAKCTKCNKCAEECMFNIDIPGYTEQGTRVKSSECVMCMKCIAVCPEGTLCSSIGFDLVTKDQLKKY